MSFSRYIRFFSQIDAVEQLPVQMRHALRDRGIEVGSRTMREDEGWGVSFRHAGDSYCFFSRFDVTSEPLECMGWLERDRGFVSSLFSSRETHSYPELEPIVQAALASLPTVRDVLWCSEDDSETSTTVT